MSRIELSDVSKRYPGGVLAVDDVSLDIKDGEFVSFVGPSGCGKTTTLRMVAGFEQPRTARSASGTRTSPTFPRIAGTPGWSSRVSRSSRT